MAAVKTRTSKGTFYKNYQKKAFLTIVQQVIWQLIKQFQHTLTFRKPETSSRGHQKVSLLLFWLTIDMSWSSFDSMLLRLDGLVSSLVYRVSKALSLLSRF